MWSFVISSAQDSGWSHAETIHNQQIGVLATIHCQPVSTSLLITLPSPRPAPTTPLPLPYGPRDRQSGGAGRPSPRYTGHPSCRPGRRRTVHIRPRWRSSSGWGCTGRTGGPSRWPGSGTGRCRGRTGPPRRPCPGCCTHTLRRGGGGRGGETDAVRRRAGAAGRHADTAEKPPAAESDQTQRATALTCPTWLSATDVNRRQASATSTRDRLSMSVFRWCISAEGWARE